MPKASPALLTAALLVLALAAPASVGGVGLLDSNTATTAPSEGVSENTTRVLRLDEIQASGFGQPRVVVIDAMDTQKTELDTEYSLSAVQERLDAAPNASARRDVLQNYTEAAAADVQALQEDERQARQAYVQGEITREEYAQKLAIIHAKASHLSRFLGGRAGPEPSLYSYASRYSSVQSRVAFLNEELQYLMGPVRSEMANAIQGDREPIRVFVAASEQGFELTRIQETGVYVRSAYRADNTDTDSSGARSIEAILRIAPTLYPWAIGENLSGPGSLAATPIPAHGTIRTTITHPHGRIYALVDHTTEQVYYEVQHKRLDTLPVEYRFNRTENGTRVLVSRSYPGGPIQVRVLDVSEGEPSPYIGNPVTVNGTTRETDFNGVAWFVSPNGEFNITTTVNGTEFQFQGGT